MQVGVMVTSYNQRDWDRVLAGDNDKPPVNPDIPIVDNSLALGAMVEPLGYDSIWCAEHYGSPYSMQSNPLQWLSYWAGRTERIDMGTAVIVAPWWQPVKLAHEIAMLDTLLDGRRLHLGIGRGVAAHEYAGFGIDREESRDRFRELIEILRLADSQESFEYDGEIYKIPETQVRPQARNKGRLMETAKAAFNTPASMDMAADLGLGQLFVAAEGEDQMISQVAKFNAIRAQKGLAPNQPTTMLYLHCSTDEEELEKGWRYVAQQTWAARNHYAVWKTESFANTKGYEEYAARFEQDAEVDENKGTHRVKQTGLVGTPEQIFDQIERLQKSISLEYLIVHPAHGAKPAPEAQASLKLFAEEVLPAVHAMETPLHEHNLGKPEDLDFVPSIGGAVG
ncbi:LLM class flavin-dependent oxidoreductase [Nocardioides carbamazepini]|uniref:LLM class flavin-dependent oxidoreductase n=1 Tax=Nocardioides carbamazepini TaxID=2854259 RepID=UPI00214A74D7|nr:LLM class flavin-dependent oxidoreductase [Nocardioides carbamazepini]MCR1781305.1 LLM class flavin-dependent oxidoreductase [Nocardioides carbamazepini]